MKSVMFYEAFDETNPQHSTLLGSKEVFDKIRQIASEKWGKYRDWTFEKWWNECWEDLWLYMKKDEHVLMSTKIVTSMYWYEKNQGAEKIFADMETLVDEFVKKWHEENPEPEEIPEMMLNENEIFKEVLKRLEDKENGFSLDNAASLNESLNSKLNSVKALV